MNQAIWLDKTHQFRGPMQQRRPESVLPDSDLEHSAEQLRVVGDDPSDMNDQLLLEDSLPFAAVSRALAVDDALDHAWRQWVWDHLLLLTEETEGHLANTGIDASVQHALERELTCSWKTGIVLHTFFFFFFFCLCRHTRGRVFTRVDRRVQPSFKVQYQQVSLYRHLKLAPSPTVTKRWVWKKWQSKNDSSVFCSWWKPSSTDYTSPIFLMRAHRFFPPRLQSMKPRTLRTCRSSLRLKLIRTGKGLEITLNSKGIRRYI